MLSVVITSSTETGSQQLQTFVSWSATAPFAGMKPRRICVFSAVRKVSQDEGGENQECRTEMKCGVLQVWRV